LFDDRIRKLGEKIVARVQASVRWIRSFSFARRMVLGVSAAFVLVCAVVVVAETVVQCNAATRLYDDLESVPHNEVGLILGTAPVLRGGVPNPYFDNRMDAALALWQAKKVSYLLVSGDNRTHRYNEPRAMKRALIARGIPSDHIITDFAGLRTLDSIIRSRRVFGQERVTIISQRFHNERAIYIADSVGMQSVGFNAQDVPTGLGLRTRVRESLARVRVLVDVLLQTQPRHLGPQIPIGELSAVDDGLE
jgi:SanA protein